MPIEYEWTMEELDKEGDIVDSHFFDTFPGLPFWHQDVGIVCDSYTNHSHTRSWAYIEDGKLPEYFTDALGNKTRKVPKRFHNEILTNKE